MKGDALASGAKSATFSAGRAKKDDPIEFHGTVAVEEQEASCPHGSPVSRVCVLCSATTMENPLSRPIDFSKYQPMNERVLLRKIVEKAESLIVQPEAFARTPNKAEVMAVPDFCAIPQVGDVVFYGEYNAEDIEIEGEKFLLVDIRDIRLRVRGA